MTHGAAVWRPVVKHPEFCFSDCKSVRERLGTLRVVKYGNCNPKECHENLPLQRR